MNIASAIVVYIIVWWSVFFAVLPWGVKGVWEDPDAHAKGSDLGAPQNPQMGRKFLRTTWISAIVWVLVIGFIHSGLVSFRE